MPVIPKSELLGPELGPSDEELEGKINAALKSAKARGEEVARLNLNLTAAPGTAGGPVAQRALAMLRDAGYEAKLEVRSYHILINLLW